MKKKIIAAIIIVITLILLIPIQMNLKDGGTVVYRALLYKISDVHSLASLEDMEKGKEYNEGTIIEILGFELYNSVDAPLNDLIPMLMVDGKIYLNTGVTEEPVTSITDFDKEIISTVDQSEKPTKDGQSNFGCVGNSYAVDDKGIIVIIDDKWIRFEIE